jgi:hypothetical protein
MPRQLAGALAAAGLLIFLASSSVAAGGPPADGFYVDGDLYRTVGTPTEFSDSGAPDNTFDVIYALGSGLVNVAEAKPGDTDYNGGRWMVLAVTWAGGVTPVQLVSAEEVQAYAEAGLLTIGSEPVLEFECPVIRAAGG